MDVTDSGIGDLRVRDEWNRFGREPRPGDLLDRHVGRMSVKKHEDPLAQLQIAILRNHLDLMRAALDDEHVDPGTARRIIERVIYGATPNPVEIEQRTLMTTRMTEALKNQPLPEFVKLPDGR